MSQINRKKDAHQPNRRDKLSTEVAPQGLCAQDALRTRFIEKQCKRLKTDEG